VACARVALLDDGVKLTDLNPRFLNSGGPGITHKNAAGEWEEPPLVRGVGVVLDCPCGKCGDELYVPFSVALDGTARPDGTHPGWEREGDTFEILTLKPSVLRIQSRGGCGWHGFISNGEVTTC